MQKLLHFVDPKSCKMSIFSFTCSPLLNLLSLFPQTFCAPPPYLFYRLKSASIQPGRRPAGLTVHLNLARILLFPAQGGDGSAPRSPGGGPARTSPRRLLPAAGWRERAIPSSVLTRGMPQPSRTPRRFSHRRAQQMNGCGSCAICHAGRTRLLFSNI